MLCSTDISWVVNPAWYISLYIEQWAMLISNHYGCTYRNTPRTSFRYRIGAAWFLICNSSYHNTWRWHLRLSIQEISWLRSSYWLLLARNWDLPWRWKSSSLNLMGILWDFIPRPHGLPIRLAHYPKGEFFQTLAAKRCTHPVDLSLRCEFTQRLGSSTMYTNRFTQGCTTRIRYSLLGVSTSTPCGIDHAQIFGRRGWESRNTWIASPTRVSRVSLYLPGLVCCDWKAELMISSHAEVETAITIEFTRQDWSRKPILTRHHAPASVSSRCTMLNSLCPVSVFAVPVNWLSDRRRATKDNRGNRESSCATLLVKTDSAWMIPAIKTMRIKAWRWRICCTNSKIGWPLRVNKKDCLTILKMLLLMVTGYFHMKKHGKRWKPVHTQMPLVPHPAPKARSRSLPHKQLDKRLFGDLERRS